MGSEMCIRDRYVSFSYTKPELLRCTIRRALPERAWHPSSSHCTMSAAVARSIARSRSHSQVASGWLRVASITVVAWPYSGPSSRPSTPWAWVRGGASHRAAGGTARDSSGQPGQPGQHSGQPEAVSSEALRAMLRKCACVSQSVSINFVLLFIITIDIS